MEKLKKNGNCDINGGISKLVDIIIEYEKRFIYSCVDFQFGRFMYVTWLYRFIFNF